MSNVKTVVARTPEELARLLGISPAAMVEMQIRRQLNDKIVQAVKESGLTHAQAAKRAQTSRTRLTAILNRNTAQVSTDLMLRILAALGYHAKMTFSRVRHAA